MNDCSIPSVEGLNLKRQFRFGERFMHELKLAVLIINNYNVKNMMWERNHSVIVSSSVSKGAFIFLATFRLEHRTGSFVSFEVRCQGGANSLKKMFRIARAQSERCMLSVSPHPSDAPCSILLRRIDLNGSD